MLSYQHGYHAGCVADIIKHITLVQLLQYLVKKDKPLLYLETHAGQGRYDLLSAQSTKTGEAEQGIIQLWDHVETLPKIFAPYLQIIQRENPNGKLRYYPGSPLFALHLLRHCDRFLACELHPQEFKKLQQVQETYQGNMRSIQLQHTEGMAALKASVPPKERRGLIFIDPAYEIKTEYRTIAHEIAEAYKRFSTGVYCLWYPIVDKRWRDQLLMQLSKIPSESPLRIEFYWDKKARQSMVGCGLWIINPPYVLRNELQQVLDVLVQTFNPGVSSYILETVNSARLTK